MNKIATPATHSLIRITDNLTADEIAAHIEFIMAVFRDKTKFPNYYVARCLITHYEFMGLFREKIKRDTAELFKREKCYAFAKRYLNEPHDRDEILIPQFNDYYETYAKMFHAIDIILQKIGLDCVADLRTFNYGALQIKLNELPHEFPADERHYDLVNLKFFAHELTTLDEMGVWSYKGLGHEQTNRFITAKIDAEKYLSLAGRNTKAERCAKGEKEMRIVAEQNIKAERDRTTIAERETETAQIIAQAEREARERAETETKEAKALKLDELLKQTQFSPTAQPVNKRGRKKGTVKNPDRCTKEGLLSLFAPAINAGKASYSTLCNWRTGKTKPPDIGLPFPDWRVCPMSVVKEYADKFNLIVCNSATILSSGKAETFEALKEYAEEFEGANYGASKVKGKDLNSKKSMATEDQQIRGLDRKKKRKIDD